MSPRKPVLTGSDVGEILDNHLETDHRRGPRGRRLDGLGHHLNWFIRPGDRLFIAGLCAVVAR